MHIESEKYDFLMYTHLDTPCEEDGFQCPSGSPCFSLNWVCDGYRQCSDGYDEQNCTCENI